ncbi:hypothetical protein C1Y63_11765 [Corynebacterium sp. 13CS0277]|uniref:S1 family peptidase n=1 Tax=Corynebacterium sp. 13CS0277 TaxID=2071994 RepID=UPI000D03FF89|nr:serine protease [Corynebacterium sp. 13CS0277]PRQ10368.1 hypothetical protein C1Y63_11765 [Corynebacterium sp. 13CS0277]
MTSKLSRGAAAILAAGCLLAVSAPAQAEPWDTPGDAGVAAADLVDAGAAAEAESLDGLDGESAAEAAGAAAAPWGEVARVAANTRHAQFDAIVRVGNCSGSIIALPDAEPGDQALILTNGHCYNNRMRAGDVVTNMPSRQRVYLFAGDRARKIGTLTTTRALYSTTTGSDITIFDAGITYEELYRRYRTIPRIVANDTAGPGTGVQVTSGYWKRSYDCTITANVDKLKEGGWTWQGAFRMEGPGCSTRSGSSGSPVIDSTGRVVAVNNTANFHGNYCTDVNACEVNLDPRSGYTNTTVHRGARYATRVDQLAGCFTHSRTDLGRWECELYGGAAHTGHDQNYWR